MDLWRSSFWPLKPLACCEGVIHDLRPPSSLFLCHQVTATDRDGPINNLLRYSIVSGDLLQQFSIHPRSGEITVRTALDREEVSVFKINKIK